MSGGDCNDVLPEGIMIHPSAMEFCNALDDNCNGSVDEGVQSIFYEDADGDSYGNILITALACSVPAGFSSDSADCNDSVMTGASIHPSAAEVCNETDDNCDGQLDEGFNPYSLLMKTATGLETFPLWQLHVYFPKVM